MLFRSTGLGKTELVGKVVEMKREGDYLVLCVDTLEPVKWRIRAAMSFKDFATVIRACGKFRVLSFLLSPAQWFNRQPRHPENF
ncbi:MAG: hypothetical protein IBX68_07575 [Dehalococcoidia bacterium]|nr:hypothetical protein [Dehalococcoidia bacterium]